MSITLGIYDFFSYIIPGFLYLYAFNEFLGILQWKHIDIASWFLPEQTPSIVLLISLLITAFIVGHIFDPIAHKFYDLLSRLQRSQSTSEKSLASIKGRYPELNVQFHPLDWSTLFVLIRLRNLEVSKFIDKFNADAIMLRNIAFSLLLLSSNYVVGFILNEQWHLFFIALLLIGLSILARSRSNDFRLRFFKHIYRTSLEYGLNLKEVIEYNKNNNRQNRRSKDK